MPDGLAHALEANPSGRATDRPIAFTAGMVSKRLRKGASPAFRGGWRCRSRCLESHLFCPIKRRYWWKAHKQRGIKKSKFQSVEAQPPFFTVSLRTIEPLTRWCGGDVKRSCTDVACCRLNADRGCRAWWHTYGMHTLQCFEICLFHVGQIQLS